MPKLFNNMKILNIVGFYPEFGGPYSAVKDVSIALSNKGLEVNVLSPIPRDYNVENLYRETPDSLNVKYIRVGFLSNTFPSFSTRWKTVIKDMLPRIDLVHVHGMFDHYTYVTSRLSKQKPIIISPRGSIMNDALSTNRYVRKYLYLNSIGKSIIRKASAIHLVNQYEKEEFLNVFKANSKEFKDKILVIPNGINLEEFKNLPPVGSFKQKYSLLRDKKYIIFLGRINVIKGLDILVESFKKLAAIYDDLYLVIVGPDNKGYEKRVKKWLNDAGLLGRSVFTGMLTGRDKLEAFVDAEVFVLPSYSENFGMAAVEAMACGIPVVISNKVGIQKEIKENKAGIVVETDPESLFDGIKTLLDNKELRREFAKNGEKLLEEYYNIDKVADMMIKAYEDILSNAK